MAEQPVLPITTVCYSKLMQAANGFATMWGKYKSFTPFFDSEAWMLFKLAAIAEAVGWTLLISGILSKRFLFHSNDLSVQVTGRLHGTLFIIYIVAALVLAPSLRWTLPRTILAGLSSVPPYGSLLFEMWEQHRRNRSDFRQWYHRLRFYMLTSY